MRAIGISSAWAAMLAVCLALASVAWAAGDGQAPSSLGFTKQGASGQVYTWQAGSC